ncbi:MAG: hypothetical protein JRF69_12240 [Deltaproteobacteria bacterium]|nr:hypothetical protein [Deltaproteobacteria bacterium]
MTKMKYEQPLLIPLNYTEVGHGQNGKCKEGSAEADRCEQGPMALHVCNAGPTQIKGKGKCKLGGVAA